VTGSGKAGGKFRHFQLLGLLHSSCTNYSGCENDWSLGRPKPCVTDLAGQIYSCLVILHHVIWNSVAAHGAIGASGYKTRY
jgi:hypothetical protein